MNHDTRNWRDFLLNFKSWLYYADKTFESGLSNMESNPKNVVSLSAMNEESKTKAVQLYAILTGLLKGKPLRLLRQQDDRNGLEVYRQLVPLFTPQSKTRSLSILQAFMEFPVFTKDKTLSEKRGTLFFNPQTLFSLTSTDFFNPQTLFLISRPFLLTPTPSFLNPRRPWNLFF